MFIEMFSDDVVVHGDGVAALAKFNLIGWPFNLDLSEAHKSNISAYVVVGAAGEKVGAFTVSLQDDRVLLPSHGLVDGDQIRFVLDDPESCVLPFPLNDGDDYFVVGARGNDFQVSSTAGGALINMTDHGVGVNEVWKGGGSGGETLEAIGCERSGSFITLQFPEVVPGGETRTVRLRAKVFI